MEDEVLLSKEEVNAVVEFSNALYMADRYGYYNPLASSRIMQSLGGHRLAPTLENIKKALSELRTHPDVVSSYMDFMKSYDMMFAKTIKQYTTILAYDMIPVCKNAYTEEDYESEEYKADKALLYDFLDKFDYKEEFRKVTEQAFLRETYYTWFRKAKWRNKGMKYALQVMPQEYCILTGYWEKGLLFDFDMSYFMNAGVDIDEFDPKFKTYYNKLFKTKDEYKPSASLKKRNGKWGDWVQTSPVDGAWAWKFQMDNFDCAPYLAPMLRYAVRNEEVEKLQRNKDIASAYAIVAGTIGTFDGAKSGTKYDQLKFNPATLGGFMRKAKAGMDDTLKLMALPVEGIKMMQFSDANPKMESNQLDQYGAIGSYVNSPLYATEKMSASEVEVGATIMYNIMKPMYAQFANFMEYQCDSITTKYKWKFIFDGSTYDFLRTKKIDNIFKLSASGMVMPPAVWGSVLGYAPQDFERMMIESKYNGWSDLWQVPFNMYTTTDGGVTGGSHNGSGDPDRDLKDSTQIADSTESSRDSESL